MDITPKCSNCGHKTWFVKCSQCGHEGNVVGSQKSLPSGGCAASGRVTAPVAVDGEEVSGKAVYLKEVHEFDGPGWYLQRYESGGFKAFELDDSDAYFPVHGEVRKICLR